MLTIKFSPDSNQIDWPETTNGLIAQTLAQAQQKINLALFVFSEQPLADVLEEKHNQGAEIKVLIDPGFAYRPYSEALDLLGVTLPVKDKKTQSCRVETENKPWSNPIQTVGIPALPEGDKLHNKLGIIDNYLVITGSHNWSSSANRTNDETLLILDSPTINAHYQRAFQQLYQSAELGVPDFLQKAIAKLEKQCVYSQPTVTSSSTKTVTKSESNPTGNSPVTTSLININNASQAELESLPGIGPKLASRIIFARQQQPFTSLEDLKRVEGIKDSKLNKLSGKITW